MVRTPWVRKFVASEEEVSGLRRGVRARLDEWGLPKHADDVQLCVSELVANVIGHVGTGTPTTLALLMNGAYLRIEVHDPDPRALPTLVAADTESEGGRGMALVSALTDRWGVHLHADRKVTWCEIATVPDAVTEYVPWPASAPGTETGRTRAETVIDLYDPTPVPGRLRSGRLGAAQAEEAAISVITDLLHWLGARGRDADDVLDRAQMRYEARLPSVSS